MRNQRYLLPHILVVGIVNRFPPTKGIVGRAVSVSSLVESKIYVYYLPIVYMIQQNVLSHKIPENLLFHQLGFPE